MLRLVGPLITCSLALASTFLHQLLARSVNHGWAGLQSFDDPVDAQPFAALPDQRFKPFAFLAAQPHTVSGLALDP